SLDFRLEGLQEFDAAGKYVVPGLIDQHIHIAGAGGKDGFASMTAEIPAADLIRCGTTTSSGWVHRCQAIRPM
ncbi:MAG: amidohydrolase family protein, partial [Bacteroidia bacterium]